MQDLIFYPDRSAREADRFYREGVEFFETTVRRHQMDPIFYPDLDPEEVIDVRCEAKDFFDSIMRRKK